LAESWNGKSWPIRKTPVPAGGAGGTLGGVTCIATSNCTAVGSYFNASRSVPLVEHWNGRRWAPRHAAIPGGTAPSHLASVSCASMHACSAVGSRGSSMLAEHWNGKIWSVQGTPAPPGAVSPALSAVSCPAVTVCTAAGFFTNSAQTQTILAERYS
jgi:hypothetical protein